MLINKTSLLAVNIASKDATRESINSLHVTPSHCVATDGHRLIQVTHQKDHVDTDYPAIDGMKGGEATELVPFTVPADAVKSILKALPKTKIPIVNHVQLDVAATNANGHVKLAVTDLENPQVFTPRKIDAQFPNFEQVLPKGEPVFTTSFNPELLADTLETLFKMQGGKEPKGVKLEFFGPDKPVRMTTRNEATGQEILSVVMPMR